MKKHRKKHNVEDIIFNLINTTIMLITIIVMLYPFWNTVAVSFNDAQDTLRGGIKFFPRIFSLYSYEYIFKDNLIARAAANSVLRTVIATVLGVFVGSLIAYVLSRKELVGKKFFTTFFLITMYVSAGLIPNYFLIKDLGLLNKFSVYILPGLISVYNIIVIKSYMQGLPDSLTEAAMVDGAGHFRCYLQIVMPCCKPVLATIALWCAVGAWNQWFDTFLYASSKENLSTLQYEMMKLLSSAMQAGKSGGSIYGEAAKNANTVTPASMRAAITIVASVPILVVYPFVQRYFVKGVTLGSVKG